MRVICSRSILQTEQLLFNRGRLKGDRGILVFYLRISLKTSVTQPYLGNIHNFDGCQLTCFNMSTLKNRKKRKIIGTNALHHDENRMAEVSTNHLFFPKSDDDRVPGSPKRTIWFYSFVRLREPHWMNQTNSITNKFWLKKKINSLFSWVSFTYHYLSIRTS